MQKLKEFFKSHWYYALIIFITILFNALDLGIIGFGLLIVLICANLIINDDFSPSMITIGACVYVFNEIPVTPPYYLVFGIAFALLIPCLIYFIIKNLRAGTKFKFGVLFIPLVLLVVAYTFGGIFSPYYDLTSFAFGGIISVLVLVGYLLIYNFCKIPFKDLAFYLIGVSSLIIIGQMLVCYLASGDIINMLQHKGVRVGIGEINLPALTIAMWLPLLLHKGIASKYDYLYLLAMFGCLLSVVLTFSRGALLVSLIFGLVSVIVFFCKSSSKRNISITLGCIGLIVGLCLVIYLPSLNAVFEYYVKRGFDDSGRFELYESALQYFSQSPIFGVGWQVDTYGLIYSMFHSTPLQILASTGIIGVLLILPHYIQRYYYVLKGFDLYSVFALMSILICEGYGLIDQTSTYSMSYIFVIVLVLACMQNKQVQADGNKNLVKGEKYEKNTNFNSDRR